MTQQSRVRSAPYTISFIARGNETYIFIGSMWAGRIVHPGEESLNKVDTYGVYLQLPGMWGPVCQKDSMYAAKIGATEALKEWLSKFTEEPHVPPMQLVKRVVKQDAVEGRYMPRVRITPIQSVKRISRTRR